MLHDLALAAQVCDDVAVMYGGQIVEEGPARAVLTRPMHPYTRGLRGCVRRVRRRAPRTARRHVPVAVVDATRLPLRAALRRTCRPRARRSARRSSRRDDRSRLLAPMHDSRALRPPPSGAPLFSLLDVEKTYSRRCAAARRLRALDGIRLTLQPGETPRAGRRERLRQVDAGARDARPEPADRRPRTVRRDRARRLDGAQRRRFAARSRYIYQDARGSLNPRMTVAELLAEPIRLHAPARPRPRSGRVDALLERVGLPPRRAHQGAVRALRRPGAARRRRACARRRAARDRRRRVGRRTRRLGAGSVAEPAARPAAREGLAMVFITHDLGVAAYLCDASR